MSCRTITVAADRDASGAAAGVAAAAAAAGGGDDDAARMRPVLEFCPASGASSCSGGSGTRSSPVVN